MIREIFQTPKARAIVSSIIPTLIILFLRREQPLDLESSLVTIILAAISIISTISLYTNAVDVGYQEFWDRRRKRRRKTT